MNRFVRRFQGWPGTAAAVIGLVAALVTRIGLAAGWPKPVLLLLAFGIEVPVLLWAGSYVVVTRRGRDREKRP